MSYTRRVPSANRKRVIKLRVRAYSRDALNFSQHRTNRSATRVHGKYWRTSASRQSQCSRDESHRWTRELCVPLGAFLYNQSAWNIDEIRWQKTWHLAYRYLCRFLSSISIKKRGKKEKKGVRKNTKINIFNHVILPLYIATRVNIRIRIISVLEL